MGFYDFPNIGSPLPRTREISRVQYDAPTFIKLAKAAVTSSSFTNDYGKLLPFRVQQLEDYIEDNSMFKGMCDFMTFNAENGYIDSVARSSSWNWYPQDETGSNDVIRGISTARKTFAPVDFYMIMEISDKALRINLEGDNFIDHLLQIAAKGTANDWDRMILLGNTTGVIGQDEDVTGYAADKYHILPTMSKIDGVVPLLLTNGYVLDVSNFATTWFNPIIAEAMQEKVPVDRSAFLPLMKYFCSRKAWGNYAFHLGNKGANTPFDFALYNAYMAGIQKLMHVDIPIEKVPLLDDNPKIPETFQIGTALGTHALTYYPVKANSQIIIPNAGGASFVTPQEENTDYTFTDSDGVITDINLGTSTVYNCTYQIPGIAFLTWPFNIVLGMAYNDVTIEFGREPKNNKDYMILRCSIDLLIRDYFSAVIAWGLTYRAWSGVTA